EDLLVHLAPRREAPHAGRHALPSTTVRAGESTEDAIQRLLQTRADLPALYLQQLYTFSAPQRDPRGPSLSIAYYALMPAAEGARDDWLPLRHALKMDLAFDHAQILETALKRLQ